MADLVVSATLSEVEQISGEGGQIGVIFNIKPGEAITIATGKTAVFEIDFTLTPPGGSGESKSIAQTLSGQIEISAETGYSLTDPYYPGVVLTTDNLNTVITAATAKIFLPS